MVTAKRVSSADLDAALEAVSQMFAQVKAEPTPAEAMLWADEIERLGPQAVQRFAVFWMSGGGQGNFLRAPRIEDLRRYCDPAWADEGLALERLKQMVVDCGPYQVPGAAQGMDERLAEAVRLLGGWPKVCEILPDASDDFAMRAFEKRFAVAWQQAQGRALRAALSHEPLRALGSAPATGGVTDGASDGAEEAPRLGVGA